MKKEHEMRLELIECKLDNVIRRLELMAKTLDEVLALVTEEDTVDDSIIALLTSIKQQLDGFLSGTVVSPATQAKIDDLFNKISASKDKVAAAIVANTPAAETPTEPPPA